MKKLIDRPTLAGNLKVNARYQQLSELLGVLEKKQLTQEVTEFMDQEIKQLNAVPDVEKDLVKAIKETESKIIKWVEKKLKVVPKNYYKKLWMILGMTAFGLPMGVAFGVSIGNMAFLGIGLPIGMAVGIGVGAAMDKKAFKEGRQLDFEPKL